MVSVRSLSLYSPIYFDIISSMNAGKVEIVAEFPDPSQMSDESERQKIIVQERWGTRPDFTTPIVMERHIQQGYSGQGGIWSCAVASTLNALHALGVARSSDTEDSIIHEMGGKRIFDKDGSLPMEHVQDFLRKRGLMNRPSSSIVELMQVLENGGVAVICRASNTEGTGHAVLISGAETRDGQVYVRVNDPQDTNGFRKEPALSLADQLHHLFASADMYLIENPVNR